MPPPTFPSRDPGVFTRPGSASIRPAALSDAVYELATQIGGLTPEVVQDMIDAALVAYQALAQKGQPSGYTPLDAGGRVPNIHLPPLAITETYVVASQAEQLALPAQVGDVAVRTDTGQSYILQAEPASVAGNWVALGAPSGALDLPTADARYEPIDTMYTKAESDGRYATPATVTGAITTHEGAANPHPTYLTQAEGDGFYYTKALADARYEPIDTMYTKAESDAKYATPANIAAAITAHEAAANPHPVYLTQAEADLIYAPVSGGGAVLSVNSKTGVVVLNAADVGALTQAAADLRYEPFDSAYTKAEADGRYATPANITSAVTAHEALANPHAVYATDADLTAHAGAADPHTVYHNDTRGDVRYYTKTLSDARYQPIGSYLTQAAGDLRYEPLDSAYTKAESDAKYLLPATAASTYVPLAGGSVMTGALGPTTTNTRDLGTTTIRWRKTWAVDEDLSGSAVIAVGLTVAAKAVALSPNANQTLQWLANGFFSDAPSKTVYDALVARVVTLEAQVATLNAQMGSGANGHYHPMGTWRQTAKATLPATVLEEAPAA